MAALACFARVHAVTTPPEFVSIRRSSEYGAKILPNCRAIRFEERARVVEQVVCDWNGRRVALRARVFILAANAFLTPALLQRSANDRFPDGLANSSGLVGRNLMLHASSHVFVGLKRASGDMEGRMNYGLSLNDFYVLQRREVWQFSCPSFSHAHESNNRLSCSIRCPEAFCLGASSPKSRRWEILGTFVDSVFRHPRGSSLSREPGDAAKAGSDEDIVYAYRYPAELRRSGANDDRRLRARGRHGL